MITKQRMITALRSWNLTPEVDKDGDIILQFISPLPMISHNMILQECNKNFCEYYTTVRNGRLTMVITNFREGTSLPSPWERKEPIAMKP
jgi:hypothetical protein